MARPPRSSTRAASRAASRAATRHNPMADTRRNTVANRGRPRRSAGASASSSHGTRTSTVAVADTPRSVADMSRPVGRSGTESPGGDGLQGYCSSAGGADLSHSFRCQRAGSYGNASRSYIGCAQRADR